MLPGLKIERSSDFVKRIGEPDWQFRANWKVTFMITYGDYYYSRPHTQTQSECWRSAKDGMLIGCCFLKEEAEHYIKNIKISPPGYHDQSCEELIW
jgi:hypothetical protein